MPRTPASSHPLARYVRTYVAPPRYRREHTRTLVAADGTPLRAVVLPSMGDSDVTVVLVHGFANWSRSPRVHAFAHLLARHAEVIVPDLRGHGRSGGVSTLGAAEPLDVAAAVEAVGPGRRVVTVGASLGAAAVLLHAPSASRPLDAVVAVSAPAWWRRSDRPGAQRVRTWTSTPARRAALATLARTRVAHPIPAAAHPVDAVGAIAPAATILVHDPDDAYFGAEHAEALHAAAAEPKELWWRPGAGHGSDLFTPALADDLWRRLSPQPR